MMIVVHESFTTCRGCVYKSLADDIINVEMKVKVKPRKGQLFYNYMIQYESMFVLQLLLR